MTHLVALFTLLGAPTLAGDYELTITDEPSSCPKHVESPSRQTHSVAEVAADVKTYFSDGSYKIQGFPIFIGNGHFDYCGKYDHAPLYAALAEACQSGLKQNRNDFGVFTNLISLKKLEIQIGKKRLLKCMGRK